MKKLEAELQGKARIERENREIYLEQIKLKSEEQRKTVLESIKTAGNVIGTGITTLLENPNKILMAVSENQFELMSKSKFVFLSRPVVLLY
jgi:ATPase family AAA domain-containing protein 3A/B